MKIRKFNQVDVFTAVPYKGNPLAVVMDGSDLSSEEMQHFAQWTNVSETTFLLPASPAGLAAGADYQVRIFTPGSELPFAGHPTLGSCHVWLQAGGQPHNKLEIVQECKVGLIKIRQEMGRLAFAAPPLVRSNPSPGVLAQVAAALGLKAHQILAAQLLNNGPTWLGLLLDNQQSVLQLQPNLVALKGLVAGVGVASVQIAQTAPNLIARSNREARAFGAGASKASDTDAAEPTVEVRFFAPDIGVSEDPVTGSFNASLAQWLIADGHTPPNYVAAQGCCIHRDGRIHIHQDAYGQVWVGGDAVTCIQGEVTL